MALDLSTPALVNASSGLLFVALGTFALVVGRRDAWARSVGAVATAFGAFFVTVNLWTSDAAVPYGPVLAAGGILALFALACVAVTLQVARPFEGRRRMLWLAFVAFVIAGATALVAAVSKVSFFGIPVALPSGASIWLYALPFATAYSAAAVMLGTFAIACAQAPQGELTQRGLLTVAFGAYFAFYAGTAAVPEATRTSLGLVDVLLLGNVLAFLAAWLLWLGALRDAGDRRARVILLVLLAMTLGGMVGTAFLFRGDGSLVGAPGLVRTVGAVVLAVAIFRHDLLGVPLPSVSVRRGPLAAGALGVLFIVAQIAQNVFSAQYGLVMGGIVAGAFLFAAQPLQRAFEGRFGGRVIEGHHVVTPAGAVAPGARGGAPDRREDVYRKALRLALRDRRISREEETHLHELAEELGIPGPRAHALLGEVEREHALDATRPADAAQVERETGVR